ncbi:hypothetical protein DUI87_15375 [Hirundo rustica rustica]|uniref:Uncharacterized protein n=1 Tax=Hirundo rustica rustica TaxID=333673 RepID=A0A3M0K990_HIRRU|nr:hypothetical protein DUI87_15375 [Hirundo rustica rustica]
MERKRQMQEGEANGAGSDAVETPHRAEDKTSMVPVQEGETRIRYRLGEIENGVAEISFNRKKAASSLGYDSLEALDGSYFYIVASVVESMGERETDVF